MDKALQKINPQHKVHVQMFVRWQVSQPDGTRMKDVIRCEVPASIPANAPIPQWTPDGKRLSFIYKKSLYVVPVD